MQLVKNIELFLVHHIERYNTESATSCLNSLIGRQGPYDQKTQRYRLVNNVTVFYFKLHYSAIIFHLQGTLLMTRSQPWRVEHIQNKQVAGLTLIIFPFNTHKWHTIQEKRDR